MSTVGRWCRLSDPPAVAVVLAAAVGLDVQNGQGFAGHVE